jgi:hypothetical protein
MVIYNAATRELTAKIVYYGPGLCGKTTNLKVLHDRLEPGTAGKLLNLQTQTDRTIYFDLLPVELGDIKGYKIRFQLATVPGQTAFNETRRVVLKGVDGIVFVADSQWTMLPKNLEAWQNLKDNLKVNGITFESIPVVIQYNKRDLADILAVDAMQEALGLSSFPFVEAVASAGRGVTETFKLISKLTFVDLLRRLQGRRAEDETGASVADEVSAEDDLQTWKDSLLKRESQPAVARPSRPLALVPPVGIQDEAPFDTTELSRGVDEDEPASPYSVPAPPASPDAASPRSPAATVQMDAVSFEIELPPPPGGVDVSELQGRYADQDDEAPEDLSQDDEVEIDLTPAPETAEMAETHTGEAVPAPGPPDASTPAFLSAEATRDDRVEILEQRLREAEARANREREASERISGGVAELESRVVAAAEHISALTERFTGLERGVGGLHETLGAALQRLSGIESATGRTAELEAALRRFESSLGDLDRDLRGEAGRQRKDADDLLMALSALTERAQAAEQQIASVSGQLAGFSTQMGTQQGELAGLRAATERVGGLEGQVSGLSALVEKLPELEMQIDALLRQHRELEGNFDEKTQQGRREAEDIRSQLAPLLEDRVRRHESDAMLFSEMERLRESLAESLHELAERVRSRVRE